jgi:hypothetical protein
VQALKEFADRMEGRTIHQIEATIDGNLTVEIVRFADHSAK